MGNRGVKFVSLKGGSDFVLILFFCLLKGLLLLCCLPLERLNLTEQCKTYLLFSFDL